MATRRSIIRIAFLCAVLILISGVATASGNAVTTSVNTTDSGIEQPDDNQINAEQIRITNVETGHRYTAPKGTALSDLALPAGTYKVRYPDREGDRIRLVEAESDGEVKAIQANSASSVDLRVTTGDKNRGHSQSSTVNILVGAINQSADPSIPVADVPVTITIEAPNGDTETFSRKTNTNGNVVLPYDSSNNPRGQYTIEVTSSEYATFGYGSFTVGPHTRMYPRYNSKTEVGRNVTMGIQVTRDREPVANADRTITVEYDGNTVKTATVMTDESGFATVEFRAMQEGSYRVSTDRSGTTAYIHAHEVLGTIETTHYGHRPGSDAYLVGQLYDDRQPYANERVTAVVTYENGTHYTNVTMSTNDVGQLHGRVPIPHTASDFDVQFVSGGDELSLREHIRVNEESTQEEHSYEINTDFQSDWDDPVAPGEEASIRVEVTRSDGTPVVGETVTVVPTVGWGIPISSESVTTNADGIAYHNFTVPSDVPTPESLDGRVAVTINGTTIQNSAYKNLQRYAIHSDWGSPNNPPGSTQLYNTIVRDAITGDPVSGVPISVVGVHQSFGHVSVSGAQTRMTGTDGSVSVPFYIPNSTTENIYLHSNFGSSGYVDVTRFSPEFSVSGDLTPGGEVTVSYTADTESSTRGLIALVNQKADRTVAVRPITEGEQEKIQLPVVDSGTQFMAEMRATSTEGYTTTSHSWFDIADSEKNVAPTASFTYSPSSPTVGETVTFNASGASDQDGSVSTYEWDFDNDGTAERTTTNPVVTYAFETAGDHEITLTVVDNDGATDTTMKTVDVQSNDSHDDNPIVVGTDPATDTDGDGALEDVNGDGAATVIDVQALFANRNSVAVQNNPSLFDFNGDGEVNVIDIQALFTEVA